MNRREWTMAELRRARAFAEQRMSMKAAAAKLRRSLWSLRSAAGRHGIRFNSPPPIKWTADKLIEVQYWADEGLSLRRAALQIRCSRLALAGVAHRHKITFHGEDGAPYGNQNRKGTGVILSPEERRRRKSANTRRWRTRKRLSGAAEAPEL